MSKKTISGSSNSSQYSKKKQNPTTPCKPIENELIKQTARLKILADASQAFASAGQDYKAILDQIVHQVVEALADMCLIRLISDDGQFLKLAAIYSRDSEFSEALIKIAPSISGWTDDPGLPSHVLCTGNPTFIPVITLDQMSNSLPPEYHAINPRYAPHSYIVVPLKVQGNSLGVMALTRYNPGKPSFTDDDLSMAQDLADRAVLAIHSSRLFKQLQDELIERRLVEKKTNQIKRLYATLSQVNQTIVHVKTREELYQSICNVAVEFGEFTLAWIGLLDDVTGEIKPAASKGLDINEWPFQIVNINNAISKYGLVATAIRTLKVTTSDDIHIDKRTKSQLKQINSYKYHSSAAVPFHLRGKVMGVLNLISSEKGLFMAEEEVQLLEKMGLNISFALDTIETEFERKQTVASLIESESRYSLLFNNSPVPAALLKLPEVIISDVNKALEQLVGYSKQEIVGKPALDLGFSTSSIWEQSNTKLEKFGSFAGNEARILTKSGQERIIQTSVNVIEFSGQKYALSIMQDITERKLAEIKLFEARERLSFAQHSAGAGLWDWDMSTDKLEWSPELFELFGLDKEIIPTFEVWRQAIHPADVQLAGNRIEKAIIDHLPLSSEYRIIRNSGEVRWIIALGNTTYNEQGKPQRMAGICIDITNRKLVEETLQHSEQKFAALFEKAAVPMALTKMPEGVFADVNEAFQSIYGYSKEEIVGKTSVEIGMAHPDERADTSTKLEKYGQLQDNEKHLFTRDGEPRIGLINISKTIINGQDYVITSIHDITERKHAEDTLKGTRKMLEEAQKIAHLGSFEYVAATQTTTWSEEEFRIYGMDPKGPSPEYDVMLKNCIFPEDATLLHETFTKAFQSGSVYELEHRIIQPNGNVRWVYDRAYPYFNEAGELVRYLGVTLDLTDRKLMEEELRKRNEELEQLLDRLPVAIWIANDAECKNIQGNRFANELLGVTEKANVSQSGETPAVVLRQYSHGRELKPEELPMQLAAKTGKPQLDFELHIEGRDIPTRTLLGGTVPLFDVQGKTRGVIAIFNDITERKLAEEALKKSESEFRLLADAMPQIVWTTRADGWNTYFNQQWVDYTGLTLEESSGHGWNKPFHPDDQQAAWDAWQNAVTHKSLYSIESRLRRADGVYKWWLIRGVPEFDSDGNILKWFGTCTNIDKLKNTEQEIKELNEALEQKVKDRTTKLEAANKELESFSYSVSHDLRAPLRALSGYAKILLEDYTDTLDDEGKRVVNVIISEAKRMGLLVDNLLSFSRLGRTELNISPVDMQTLVQTVFNELTTPESRERIDFRCEKLHSAMADVGLLRQVWVNLISNALKFSSEKAKSVIEVNSSINNNEIVYYAKDNGAGFDMQYASKLFGVFQRLHSESEFEGTGVGLAIVNRVVSRHGGRVWAEGKVDEGATFYFSLPERE